MKKIFITLFFVLLSCLVKADFDSALKLYQDKKFEAAATEFTALAEKGDRDAQFNLGVMYLRGEFYKKDLVEAYAWIALSANGRDENTIKAKNAIYSKLTALQKKIADTKFALYIARYSPQIASTSLEPELVDKFLTSTVPPVKTVMPVYAKRTSEDIFEIIFMLSADGRVKHIQRVAGNANTEAAINALKQFEFPVAAGQDHFIINPYVVQRFAFKLRGVPEKGMLESAKKMIDKQYLLAESGDPVAQYHLAHLYMYGSSLMRFSPKDSDFDSLKLENPNKWYALAANQGLPNAQFMLGMNMMCGNMCAADASKSLVWVLRAAQGGLSDAQLYLALNLLHHRKSADDVINAINWLELAAKQNKSAMAIYAWILATSEDQKILDAKKANELIAKVPDDYIDQLSYFETKAAVAARLGDYEKAKDFQEKALDEAEKYSYPDKLVKARLATYQSGKPWSEAF